VTNPLRSNEIVIEVHVPDLRHLFNAIDPSPFRVRDLSPEAESFIVGWAETAPRNAPLSLVVHADRWLGPDDESALRNAVQEYFGHRAEEVRRKLVCLLSVRRPRIATQGSTLAPYATLAVIAARAGG